MRNNKETMNKKTNVLFVTFVLLFGVFSSAAFAVDTTPPTIDNVADQTVEATTASGAMVTIIEPIAHDDTDPDFTATCDASTGIFPIGDTLVTCDATDLAGNVATSETFHVIVQDTTAPTIDSVSSQTVEATSSLGALVTINAPMSHDAVDGDVLSTCDQVTGTFAIGTTPVTCSRTDANGNVATPVVFNVVVQDTTAPTIDSVSSQTVEATSSLGASVTITAPMSHDVVDGDVLSTCDASSGVFSLGSVLVTCSKTDAHGNVATPQTFNVVVQDTTAPVITLVGSASLIVAQDSVYADAGATVSDVYDLSVLVVSTGSVNTAVVGSYILSYDATDVNGNVATTVTRTVNVVDQTIPVITLNGNQTIYVTQGNVYTELGAQATDNNDGNITSAIVVVSNVNVSAVGNYTVTYNVLDAANNSATQVVRNVVVLAPEVVSKKKSSRGGSSFQSTYVAPVVKPNVTVEEESTKPVVSGGGEIVVVTQPTVPSKPVVQPVVEPEVASTEPDVESDNGTLWMVVGIVAFVCLVGYFVFQSYKSQKKLDEDNND